MWGKSVNRCSTTKSEETFSKLMLVKHNQKKKKKKIEKKTQ